MPLKFCRIDRCLLSIYQSISCCSTESKIRLPDDNDDDEEEDNQVNEIISNTKSPSHSSFINFLISHPEYQSKFLDNLRSQEFKRLDISTHRSIYLDYTGGGLYPDSVVKFYADQLSKNVYGNPHSTNPSSQLSTRCTQQAKMAVLEFVDADSEVYDLIWTSNATGSMRILAEGFDFKPNQKLILGADCHNSANGMREFARRGGATIEYIDLPKDCKGLRSNLDQLKVQFNSAIPNPGLFVTTAQSNITGLKAPIHDLIPLASSSGYTTFLDAAALLPTTKLSLRSLNGTLDALGLSLYKIIGLPTGVGALIIKKTLLKSLYKPWFCGGTVQLVQAPGQALTMEQGSARFEDGTTDYLSMIGIPKALSIIDEALSDQQLGKRLSALTYWTVQQMDQLRHQKNDTRFILVRSPSVSLSKKELYELHGALIAFEVVDSMGSFVSCEVIEYAASLKGISLRAGCMCNPGGAASIMGMEDMMSELKSGETKKDIQTKWGVRAAGVTRVSFGLASNFEDAWFLIEFLKSLRSDEVLRKAIEGFYNKPRDVSAC